MKRGMTKFCTFSPNKAELTDWGCLNCKRNSIKDCLMQNSIFATKRPPRARPLSKLSLKSLGGAAGPPALEGAGGPPSTRARARARARAR